MNLKLIGVYLDETQLDYIVSQNLNFTQNNFNFTFEYFDAQSNFAQLHGVKVFPSFYFMKNNRVVDIIQGKLDTKELEERVLNITYASRS